MFDRCYSGLIKNEFLNNKVRFLTLTTAPVTAVDLSDIEKLELIRKNFDNLKKRFEKEFHKDFGDYFRVSTLEGYGVLHILFAGSYIPYNWLVMNWNEIHGSCIVDIREPRGDAYKGAMYVISQYVASQSGKKIFGYSRNWVYSGFLKDMSDCKKCCKNYNVKIRCYGFDYYFIDYKKFRYYWNIFLSKRINNEVKEVWEVMPYSDKIFECKLGDFN